MAQDELWVDPDFPPTKESLWGAGSCRLDDIIWRRPAELPLGPGLFAGGRGVNLGTYPKGASNVVQGRLGDCYLISAIVLLAQDGDLLRHLFGPPQSRSTLRSRAVTVGGLHDAVVSESGVETTEAACERVRRAGTCLSEAGQCVVRLFVEGSWQDVEVDTLLPCVDDEPAFARSRDGSEVYAALLEKAYAKKFGSYLAIDGGNMGEALLNLTGMPVEDVNLDRADTKPEALWGALKMHHESGNLIACGHFSAEGDRVVEHQHRGLMVNHAYSVIGLAEPRAPRGSSPYRLLKVSNPWGHFEWTGDWGASSSKWTPALRAELEYDGEDDGFFWMSLSDFMEYFNRLHICRVGGLRGQSFTSMKCSIPLDPGSAGGCSNFPSFCRNAMFRVEVTDPREIFVTVSQPDAREALKGSGARLTYPQVGITLLAQDFNPDVSTDAQCCSPSRWEILDKTSFWNKRDTSLVFQAERLPRSREYRIVPSCYFPEDPGMGVLHVTFQWSGQPDAVNVSLVNANVASSFSFNGRFVSSSSVSSILGRHPCYKVTAPSAPVPISVVLVKAPENLRSWAADSPLHASLRALFDVFDVNGNGVLEREEMWQLLQAMAMCDPSLSDEQLNDDAKERLFLEFDRDRTGTISFGQFVAQSNALLAVMRVPRAELVTRLESLTRNLGRPTSSPPSPEPAAAPQAEARRGARAGSRVTTRSRRGPGSGAAPASPGSGSRVRQPSSGPSAQAGGAARDVYAAVAPLGCHAAFYANATESIADGCGPKLPVMSNAAVWSESFLAKTNELWLCPFIREGCQTCTYELRVISPMRGVSVELAPERPPTEPASGSAALASTERERRQTRSPSSPGPSRGGARVQGVRNQRRTQSPQAATATSMRSAHQSVVGLGDLYANL